MEADTAASPVKRLFFALWPARDTRDAILTVTRPLVRISGGRAVVPENLHATLAFLGSVKSDRLSAIIGVADQIHAAPFAVYLDRLEFWKRPRILALCASRTPPELLNLVQNLWRGLETCGFTPEKRPFRAHVTLARKASRMPQTDSGLLVDWELDQFVLAESVTDPKGVRYAVLRRWRLGP